MARLIPTSPSGELMRNLACAILAVAYWVPEAQPGMAPQQAGERPAQAAGAVQAAEPKFRLVRAVSGSRGKEQGGQYVMDDPRTVFYLPDDRQVVVYFEWDGPLGPHHFEGMWKNPEGKVTVVSDFSYEAKQKRFAGFWTLILGESLPTGIWALEAHIDGELAGVHNFQIVLGTQPAPVAPARKMLSPSEIYQRTLSSTVSVETLRPNGDRLALGSGFFVARSQVLTGFEVIDGATSVRLIVSDGRRVSVDGVLAWNRREDWAILKTQPTQVQPLERARPDSWAVGDRCYSLDAPQEGTRTIVDGNIVGKRTFPEFGQRLNLSFSLQTLANGSPLLNEFGEVIAIVVRHSLLPGSASVDVLRQGYPLNLFGGGAPFSAQAALAVPMGVVASPSDEKPLTLLAELARTGHFTEPLVSFREIIRGTLATGVDNKGVQPTPVDEKFEFSRRQNELSVYLEWYPREKVKSIAYCRLYDIDNRMLTTSKPAKLNFNAGRMYINTWTLGIGSLPVGIYRVDVVIDASPVWRTYFRITE